MQVEIITIGDEILSGRTVDTNSAWMASELNKVGGEVAQIRSVKDTQEAIVDAMGKALPETQLVLITGGLGPTLDDKTKSALSHFFGGGMKFYPEVWAHIEALFAALGRIPNAMNRSQAELPEKCEVLPNTRGTASGMRFEKNGVYYISMPGVPVEMKGLMSNHVLPWVKEKWNEAAVVSRQLCTVGIPESELAGKLSDWERGLPENLSLAYLPSFQVVILRLTASAGQAEANEKQIREEMDKARAILGDVVFGEDGDTLEEVTGRLLLDRKALLATAESCTGGAIAAQITSIPGSSDYFSGSVVSYANSVKQSLLGVGEADLREYGAVSEPVAVQMARGVVERMTVDYAVAVTGIAGPDGGSEEKPVGTVWIAIYGPTGVQARSYRFKGGRSAVIRQTVIAALNGLRLALLRT